MIVGVSVSFSTWLCCQAGAQFFVHFKAVVAWLDKATEYRHLFLILKARCPHNISHLHKLLGSGVWNWTIFLPSAIRKLFMWYSSKAFGNISFKLKRENQFNWSQYKPNIYNFYSVTTCNLCSEFLLISPNDLTLVCRTHKSHSVLVPASSVQLINLNWLYEMDPDKLVPPPTPTPNFLKKEKLDFSICYHWSTSMFPKLQFQSQQLKSQCFGERTE